MNSQNDYGVFSHKQDIKLLPQSSGNPKEEVVEKFQEAREKREDLLNQLSRVHESSQRLRLQAQD